MAVTIIYDDQATSVANAQAQSDDLWMPLGELQAATGWELKPQGLCRDERCVPIPPGRRDQFLRSGDVVNLAALARQLGQPVVHDDAHAVWFFGESIGCAAHRARFAQGARLHPARPRRQAAFAFGLPGPQGSAAFMGKLVRMPL